MSRQITSDDEFDDISWIDNSSDKEDEPTTSSEVLEKNEISDENPKDQSSENSEQDEPTGIIDSDKFLSSIGHDDESRQSESGNNEESHHEIYIRIIDENKREEIIQTLANLPSKITGFEKDEFINNFKDSTVIKLAYISLYEAALIQNKLSSFDVQLQVLETQYDKN